MRHRLAHRKLGRATQHRIALLRNQAEALLRHERIETTVPKAKELRPFVERLITVAKRGVKAAEPKGRTLAAKRLVMRDVPNDEVVTSCSMSSRRASWSGRAATPGSCGSAIAAATAARSRRSSSSAASTIRRRPKRRRRRQESRRGAEAAEERRRAAARGRAEPARQQEGREGRRRAEQGEQARQGAAKKTTTPRKAGGS